MVDIAMCQGIGCGRKEQCYRYKASPGFRQVYCFPPRKGLECDMFWPIIDKSHIQKISEEYLDPETTKDC